MRYKLTWTSVENILAPLPPHAAPPGLGWPSPLRARSAARPAPSVGIGTHIGWRVSTRCGSSSLPAPRSETPGPSYRTTVEREETISCVHVLQWGGGGGGRWCLHTTLKAQCGKCTHCKHLHENLLLLLLGLSLTIFINLIAAGRQEVIVIVKEDRAPILLLLGDRGTIICTFVGF